MSIEADYTLCEGLGMCEAMAPDYFEVGDDGQVEILQKQPDAADRTDVKAAIDSCPTLALKLNE